MTTHTTELPATSYQRASKLHLVGEADVARCGLKPQWDGWDYHWPQADIDELVRRFGEQAKCQRCWSPQRLSVADVQPSWAKCAWCGMSVRRKHLITTAMGSKVCPDCAPISAEG